MIGSTVNPASARDKAMTFITKGKEIFNNANNVNEKEQGYMLYKRGLEQLLEYLKSKAVYY